MAKPLRGHCLCGHVRYEYAGEVGPATYCHCEDCRRCTGSAFNVGVRLDAAALRMVGGSPKGHTRRGDSGGELTRHFCPECGSPIFTSSPKHPEFVYVKAGTLDDPSAVQPAAQIWLDSAVPWHEVPAGIASFAKGRTP
jgi:hypothetical protein